MSLDRNGRRDVASLEVSEMASPVGTVRIYIMGGKPVQLTLDEVEPAPAVFSLDPPPLVREMRAALEGYFAGGEIGQELAVLVLGSRSLTPFEEAVYGRVIAIPRGHVLSYREVARKAGHARAARAVGNAMRSNPFPIFIPCHRVIRSDGGLGGFGGREDIKAALLKGEGLEIAEGRVRV